VLVAPLRVLTVNHRSVIVPRRRIGPPREHAVEARMLAPPLTLIASTPWEADRRSRMFSSPDWVELRPWCRSQSSKCWCSRYKRWDCRDTRFSLHDHALAGGGVAADVIDRAEVIRVPVQKPAGTHHCGQGPVLLNVTLVRPAGAAVLSRRRPGQAKPHVLQTGVV